MDFFVVTSFFHLIIAYKAMITQNGDSVKAWRKKPSIEKGLHNPTKKNHGIFLPKSESAGKCCDLLSPYLHFLLLLRVRSATL